MTIRHMRIFIEVYQTQNITKAAAILHMTQPAVTRAIKEMELYYGVSLFERIRHRLSVTAAGTELYGQALQIVDSFDQLEEGLHNWDACGLLRVGTSVTIGSCLLPELVLAFRKQYPQVRMQYMVQDGEALLKALLDNRLDIALIEGSIVRDGLQTKVFSGDKMALITPPGHPLLLKEKLVLADLAPYDLLMREEGSAGRTFLESVFAVHAVPFRPAMTSISTQAIVNAVRSGLGISILPGQLVADDLARGTVCTREISDADLSRQYDIVWHRNKFLSPALQTFIEICGRLSS